MRVSSAAGTRVPRQLNDRRPLLGGGFTGKLPQSWPNAVTDEPINSGEGKTPLYPLGYGLSPH
jgi:hypothetical protein